MPWKLDPRALLREVFDAGSRAVSTLAEIASSRPQPVCELVPDPAAGRNLSGVARIPDQLPLEAELRPESSNLGEVFTRRWVVELILDLVGYVDTADLASMAAVEPACGQGAFVVPMVERLLRSCGTHGRDVKTATTAIRAFDLSDVNIKTTRAAVVDVLVAHGLDESAARVLSEAWVLEGDFLLLGHNEVGAVDFVVGNPPYIRLEEVPPLRMAAYRDACETMRGRSDVFIGFIERGLRMLAPDAMLGYIVADRWMRNQYGAALRELISSGFSVEAVVQLHDVDAFEEPVLAYPAIVTIRRAGQQQAIIADTTSRFDASEAATFLRWARAEAPELVSTSVRAAKLGGWFDGRASWPTGTPEDLAIVADLEARFPPIEDTSTGTRVGIGVASGADSVYLTRDPDVVETDRLLPMAMASDTVGGQLSWSGTFLISPWENGQLVPLSKYPRLEEYYERHGATLRQRHVARRSPAAWYRTIDRVEPGLHEKSKLLFPDLKARMHPVLDDGHYYPHHNLYFVTSTRWDLEALGGLLLSDVTDLLVGAYCVKMRGGCYRFQAQYVRRIRVPHIDSIRQAERRDLARAFATRDRDAATAVALRLYGLDGLPRDRAGRIRDTA